MMDTIREGIQLEFFYYLREKVITLQPGRLGYWVPPHWQRWTQQHKSICIMFLKNFPKVNSKSNRGKWSFWMKGSGIPSRTSRHLLRASSNATATNTVNFDEDSTFDMDPVSIDKSMSMPMWQPNDSIFRPSKSGKGSKATGSPTSAPTVSIFDWIGY